MPISMVISLLLKRFRTIIPAMLTRLKAVLWKGLHVVVPKKVSQAGFYESQLLVNWLSFLASFSRNNHETWSTIIVDQF